MKKYYLTITLLFFVFFSKAKQLPIWTTAMDQLTSIDWLVKPLTTKAGIYLSADRKDIILYNGLVKRTFRLQPNVTCTEYKDMSNGQQLLRAVVPEAVISINGINCNIGGLY